MAKTLSEFISALRIELRDPSGGTDRWSEAQLTEHIQHAVRDLSEYAPRERTSDLYCLSGIPEIDMSSLSDMLQPTKVEYPIDEKPRRFCNVSHFGDTLTMDMSSPPSASPLGTLTGTVMFEGGSTAVTGSGTDFEDELVAGYYIKPSGGDTWYRVASIEDADALTLSSAVETDDDGADDEDATEYWYKQARLYYRALHALTAQATTLPTHLDQLIIDGAAAYAALAWAGEGRNEIADAIALIATAETALGAIAARITQAVADLTSGRGKVGTSATDANTAIDNLSARLTQALADLATGDEYINTVNVGDQVPAQWASYARGQMEVGLAYLNQARAYLAEDQQSSEYASLAGRELEAAATKAAEGRAYLSDISMRLSAARLMESYRKDALDRLALFREGCKTAATRQRRKVVSYGR